MTPMLNTAVRSARAAGSHIIRSLGQQPYLQVDVKGRNDFVSEVDKRAEEIIIEILQKAYPNHAFLAEESGVQEGQEASGYEWIIDPLDGTTNFLHGNPQFSVSIALRYQGRLEASVIYDPLRNDLYTASRGNGAYLNERRLRVTQLPSLYGALLGTGFPFKNTDYLDAYLSMFKALFAYVADIRRAGSAALDLAYVAAGRLDGFWEIGLKPWDMAAGILLIQEAGGLVTDFSGGENYFKHGNLVCGNPNVLKQILQLIQPHLIDGLEK